MRKIVTLSMIASAALIVSACGKTETTTTEANSMVTEMNATDTMEGTTNDTMTNVDGAMGANDMMAANTTMTTNTTETTTNASNAM